MWSASFTVQEISSSGFSIGFVERVFELLIFLIADSPSTFSPKSSGRRLRNIADTGIVIAMKIIANRIHVLRHPRVSINIWVAGSITIPPSPNPTDANAIAIPRFLKNHFATGTEVTKPPGAASPESPIIPKSNISCQDFCENPISIIDDPIIIAAITIYIRGPCTHKCMGPSSSPKLYRNRLSDRDRDYWVGRLKGFLLFPQFL